VTCLRGVPQVVSDLGGVLKVCPTSVGLCCEFLL